MLDLLFRSGTGSNHCLFDFSRCVFVDLCTVGKGRADSSGPCMPEFQRAARVLVHENAFYGDNVRAKFINDAANGFENLAEAISEGTIDAFHGSAGDVKRPVPVKINDAEARQAGARINTEYASFCSQLSLRSVPVCLR